jgi:glycosyltransferase involved in cell wall biosynthesis
VAPRVSIIMATYNRSEVLPFSIGSVRAQTFDDFELLVIGDGCTDDSAAVVAAISDPRVRWIGLEENSGHQSVPNNAGLEQARGEIIAYCGHDDLWLPDHLAGLVAAIDAGAGLAHAAIFKAPAPGDFVQVRYFERYSPGDNIPPSGVAHLRAAIARSGTWPHFRDTVRWPESDLWRRIHAAGFSFSAVPQLSVIKISAGDRRNVYRDRPSHEQAYWAERIRNEPDLMERLPLELLAGIVMPRQLRYADLARQFLGESWKRLRRRLDGTYKWPDAPGVALQRVRKFKGLGPAPARASTAGDAT